MRSETERIVFMSCEMISIALPARRNSAIFSRQRRWKSASPTASTSSTSRMSGSTCTATAKPRRTYMPEE